MNDEKDLNFNMDEVVGYILRETEGNYSYKQIGSILESYASFLKG